MRQRKTDKHLPPCVYHRHGAYYLVRKGKWLPLGKTLRAALDAYAQIMDGARTGGMPDLLNRWLAQARKPDGSSLSASTRQVYGVSVRMLSAMMPTLAPHEVRPLDVAQVKRELASSPATANRAISILRMAFAYAVENGEAQINPARDIKPYPMSARERLLTPEEMATVRAHATPRLALMIDLMYLTGQRVMDVVRIGVGDLGPDGIYFRQQKTDKRLVVAWSPELREAVDAAKALQPVRTLHLFATRERRVPSYQMVYKDFRAALDAAGIRDAQMRDFRAMSLTSAEEQGIDAQRLAGHSSRSMTQRYLRARKPVVVSGPRKAKG